MKSLITLCFCLFLTTSYCAEYTTLFLGTDSLPGNKQWDATGIIDNGTIFGVYQEAQNDQYVSKLYLFDSSKSDFIFIDSEDSWLFPIASNNAGQLLGYGQKPFIWSKELGLRYLNVFNSANIQVADLNDQGQVIGSYFSSETGLERPFIWENGVVTDLGPGSEFLNKLVALGDYVMGVTLMSINNKGDIAGCYHYGKFNERQQRYVSVGFKAFVWNGEFHLIPLSETLTQLPYKLKINNRGTLLLRTNKDTYLWNSKKGIQLLPGFNGIALNDASTVLGFKRISSKIDSNEVPAIWRKDKIITLAKLLGISDVTNMAPSFSDTYQVERLETILDINNNGQILCTGLLWGEKHPCILQPVENINPPRE